MALWSALSMLPDADVIGFVMGVEYGDPWGHRGATHSLAFSIVLGTAIGLVAPRFRLGAARTGLTASLALVSHVLLDTLTNGGLGCALFWPFDLTRYFAPWNPIPVAPIGLYFFSSYGLIVSLVEVVLFAPMFAYALWPRVKKVPWRAAASFVAFWSVAVWLLSSHDPLRESIVGIILREQTEYASGFSEKALRAVRRGQSFDEVRLALGAPLNEDWFYRFDETQPCMALDFAQDVVVRARDAEACLELGIDTGTARAAVQSTLGLPETACWMYTRSTGQGYFRERRVCFESGKVFHVFRQWSSKILN